MTDFVDQDLSGSHFEQVSLRNAMLSQVRLNDATMRNVDFSGVQIRAALLHRTPERAKMRPADPGGFREAWAILERLWEGTLERARSLPEEALHVRVDGEWSFID